MPDGKKRLNCFICGSSLIAAFANLLLGYDIGVMSGAIIYVEKVLHLDTWQIQATVASLNLVSGFGGLVAGKVSDAFGRRKTMLVASLLLLGGSILMAIADSFAMLLLGRLITGLGVGAGMVIAPLYLSEFSPPELRGRMVSLVSLTQNIGILLGYIGAFALSPLPEDVNWRYMLGIGAIPAFFLFLSVTLMSESPRWLIAQGRISDAAAVLSRLCVDGEEVRQRIAEVTQTLALEASTVVPQWKDIVCPAKGTAMHRIIFVAFLLNFFHQGTGNEAAVYFTPHTLREAGITSDSALLGATVAVGAAKTTVVLIAAPLLDRFGRRPMLLLSGVAQAFALSLLGISFAIGTSVALTLTAQISFVAAFAIGFGPGNWIVLSEICPLRVRGRAMAVGTLINRLTSGTVALTFLSFADAISRSGVFFFYSGMACLAVAFVWFYVPETKNKSLEQIEAEFLSGGSSQLHQPSGQHAGYERAHDESSPIADSASPDADADGPAEAAENGNSDVRLDRTNGHDRHAD